LAKKRYLFQWRDTVRKSGLRSTVRLVLHEIGFFADADGRSVFPSQQLIADNTGLDRSTVNKLIKEAVEEGFLEIYKRKSVKWSANSYRLTIPKGVTEDHRGVTEDNTNTTYNTSLKNSKESNDSNEDNLSNINSNSKDSKATKESLDSNVTVALSSSDVSSKGWLSFYSELLSSKHFKEHKAALESRFSLPEGLEWTDVIACKADDLLRVFHANSVWPDESVVHQFFRSSVIESAEEFLRRGGEI